DGYRVEKRPEQNQLVESARLLPIATKKKRDQPDRKNHSTDGIGPNHRFGNCDESHDCRRIHRAGAHDDSFPGTLARIGKRLSSDEIAADAEPNPPHRFYI